MSLAAARGGAVFAAALCFFCAAGTVRAQSSRADTALVQMARAEVLFYDIPQVESLEQPGIVRSRYNTVYPVSWTLRDASLSNGEALINFFVIRLRGREQKAQTADTFHDKSTHKGIAEGYGAQYLRSAYFRTAAGKSAVRINMYRKTKSGGEYVYVYFVLLNASSVVSSTAVAQTADPAGSGKEPENISKYEVLFDAMVKNIDRR